MPVPDGYTWQDFIQQVKTKLRIIGVSEVYLASVRYEGGLLPTYVLTRTCMMPLRVLREGWHVACRDTATMFCACVCTERTKGDQPGRATRYR